MDLWTQMQPEWCVFIMHANHLRDLQSLASHSRLDLLQAVLKRLHRCLHPTQQIPYWEVASETTRVSPPNPARELGTHGTMTWVCLHLQLPKVSGMRHHVRTPQAGNLAQRRDLDIEGAWKRF
jgi:hypothetical protein